MSIIMTFNQNSHVGYVEKKSYTVILTCASQYLETITLWTAHGSNVVCCTRPVVVCQKLIKDISVPLSKDILPLVRGRCSIFEKQFMYGPIS